jgi:NTP pyrophosphatase (non-canonical NTP hydrolase)
MNFQEYQENALKTAKAGDFKFNLVHAAMGLAGEAGEFTDCIKKYVIYGQSLDKSNALEELGDALWFVALACDTLGVSMQQIAAQNIAKLQKRYPEKYSDERAAERLDKNETGEINE